MKYKYTLLKQDGTTEEIGTFDKELPFKTMTNQKTGEVTRGLYSYLNCSIIESIPQDYWPNNWRKEDGIIIWGDEEARFNTENTRNDHMKVLIDGFGGTWDCVGDLIKEEQVL